MGAWHDTGLEDEIGGWQCLSRYVDIGSGSPLPNNIAYYVVGRADGPRRMKLSLNVNAPSDKAEALRTLVEKSSTLTRKALNVELPPAITEAIAKARNGSASVAGHELTVERDNFGPSGIRGGFNLRFVMTSAVSP